MTPAQWAMLPALERQRLQIEQLNKYHRELSGISDDPAERLAIVDALFHPAPRRQRAVTR